MLTIDVSYNSMKLKMFNIHMGKMNPRYIFHLINLIGYEKNYSKG